MDILRSPQYERAFTCSTNVMTISRRRNTSFSPYRHLLRWVTFLDMNIQPGEMIMSTSWSISDEPSALHVEMLRSQSNLDAQDDTTQIDGAFRLGANNKFQSIIYTARANAFSHRKVFVSCTTSLASTPPLNISLESTAPHSLSLGSDGEHLPATHEPQYSTII